MKGFELSVNFLVIVILSIVVLGGGIFLMVKVVGGAEKYTTELTTQMQQELDKLMDSGQLVVLPRSQVTMKRNTFQVLPLGISNEGVVDDFYVNITTNISNDATPPLMFQDIGNITYFIGPYHLERDAREKIGIGIKVSKAAVPGTYIIGVQVCREPMPVCDRYGDPKRILVTVT